MRETYRPIIMPIAIQAAYAVGFLVVGIIISKLAGRAVARKIRRQHPKDPSTIKTATIVRNIIGATSLIFVLLISISILGVNISLIIGGIGLAIGYAMEEILGNIFASLMIVTHHKYQVGDIIQISGDVSAFGTIIEVGTRFTVIQGYDLQRIMIPNLTMIRNPIITFSAESMIRCTTTLTLPRSTNISKVRPLLTDVVNRHTATTANEYTTVLISGYNEAGISLTIYHYIDIHNTDGIGRLRYMGDIRNAIHQTLQQHQIVVPYPHTLLETSKLPH